MTFWLTAERTAESHRWQADQQKRPRSRPREEAEKLAIDLSPRPFYKPWSSRVWAIKNAHWRLWIA